MRFLLGFCCQVLVSLVFHAFRDLLRNYCYVEVSLLVVANLYDPGGLELKERTGYDMNLIRKTKEKT